MKKAQVMLLVVATLIGAVSASAHESFRIVGTISKVSDRQMDVKDKASKTFTVALTKGTIVKRDKETTTLPVTALDIRIVPPIGSKPAK